VRILIANDDGIRAAGIRALEAALAPLGDIWVVAPDREQSAASHSLSLYRPLRVEQLDDRHFAVDGTPTDAVNLAINGIMKVRPDLVVSGINHGGNLGDDITYSGTVSAAMEGTLLGVPSIAVSLMDGGEVAAAARVARLVAMRVLVEGLPPKTLLNVNVPREASRGIRFTRLGHRVYSEKVVEQSDPRGRTHYWLGGGPPQWEALEGTDMGAVHEGFVAVTPLHMDLTNHRALALMTDWGGALDGQLRREASRPAPPPTPARKKRARRG